MLVLSVQTDENDGKPGLLGAQLAAKLQLVDYEHRQVGGTTVQNRSRVDLVTIHLDLIARLAKPPGHQAVGEHPVLDEGNQSHDTDRSFLTPAPASLRYMYQNGRACIFIRQHV